SQPDMPWLGCRARMQQATAGHALPAAFRYADVDIRRQRSLTVRVHCHARLPETSDGSGRPCYPSCELDRVSSPEGQYPQSLPISLREMVPTTSSVLAPHTLQRRV